MSRDIRVKDLTEDEVARIRKVITEEGNVEGDLRKKIQLDIRRLIDIGSYRGIRHRDGPSLPGAADAHQRAHPQGPRRAIAGKKKRPPRSRAA